MTGGQLVAPPLSVASLAGLDDITREHVRRILVEGTSPATRRAHASDLGYFWAWAAAARQLSPAYPVSSELVVTFIAHHLEGLPPEVDSSLVAAGAKARLGPHRLATVRRRVGTLSRLHQLAELPNPAADATVRELLSRAARRDASRGVTPAKKRAAARDVLEALLATSTENALLDLRDRALLLFAFSTGGRRRSEVASARVEDLEVVPGGYLFRLRRSKTDAEGKGQVFPLLGRAAAAVERWCAAGGITEGALFRSVDRLGRVSGRPLAAKSVALVVQRRAELAGYDPEEFGGHSLRSGFVTEAGRRGVPLHRAMEMSGHRSARVAAGYHQAGAVVDHPAARLAD